MIRALVLAACLCFVQEQEDASPIEQEIARLIEKVNELETFHLVYDLQSTSEDGTSKATLDAVYQAPEFLRLRITSDEGEMDTWVDERQLFSRSTLSGEDGGWRRAVSPDSSHARTLLEELFPSAALPLGPGPVLYMNPAEDPGLEEPRFDIRVIRHGGSRRCVMGWLRYLQRQASSVSIEEKSLVLEAKQFRLHVSRSTGILEHVVPTSGDGTFEIHLQEFHLDETIDEDLVTLPAEARAAEPDPEMTLWTRSQETGSLRREAFLRVEAQLAPGKRSWNEDVRTDWHTVIAALHREKITNDFSEWIGSMDEYVDRLVEWIEERLDQDDSEAARAMIAEHVAEGRSRLEDRLGSARQKYNDALPPIESERYEPRTELFELETEAIDALWLELLSEPVLKAFDEKVQAALQR